MEGLSSLQTFCKIRDGKSFICQFKVDKFLFVNLKFAYQVAGEKSAWRLFERRQALTLLKKAPDEVLASIKETPSVA